MMNPPPPPHAAHHQYPHHPQRRHPPQQHSFRHGPPPPPPSPHAPPLSPGYSMLYGGGGLHTPPRPPRASQNRGGSLQHPPQLMQPPLVHRTNSMEGRSRAASSSSGAAGDPPPPPAAVAENKWICDYCNIASFSNYEEACAHEVMCQRSFLNTGGPAGPSAGLLTMGSRSYSMGASMDQDDMSLSSYSPSMLSSPVPAYHPGGMLPLSSPMVSPLPVLGHHGSGGGAGGPYPPPPSSPHGYAGHGPVAMAAARRHRLRQAHAAAEQQYQASMMSSRNMSLNSETMMGHPTAPPPPSSHPYYAPQGRRFEERNRSGVSSLSSKASASVAAATSKGSTKQDRQKPQLPTMTVEERHKQEAHLQSMAGYLVNPSDVDMIPPYVYSLMRQVEPCLFTEADRFVARSKGPVGYPGFQCRHCNGHAGLGKYFPVSSKSFSTNSTSQNIHAHMLKCRKCPEAVKEQLIQLKIEKSRAARLEPGWRKVFFDKVWHRLHYCEGNSTKSGSNTAPCVGINQSNTSISTSMNENTEGQTDDSNAITDPVSTSKGNSNNNSNMKNQDTNTVQNNMTKV